MTEKEFKKLSRNNHKKASLHYWPNLNGKCKNGWVLHHKDPSWKTNDPIRYAEWRIEDLTPMTRAEHAELHRKLLWNDPTFKENQIKSLKEVANNPESLELRRLNAQRSWNDEAIRERRIKGLKTAGQRAEVKKKHSDIMHKRYEDPIERKLHSERMKAAHSNTSTKEKMSFAQSKLHNKPEVKEKFRAMMMGNTIAKGTFWWNNGKDCKMSKECPRR